MSRTDRLDYLRRAQAYRALDTRLQAQTRFFGAAALLCEVLAQLSASPARFTVSGAVRRFLAALSRELEALNYRIAAGLATPVAAPVMLDARIVHIEQHYVQRRLDALRSRSRHASEQLVRHCNRLLNAPARVCGGAEAALRLNAVLGQLRQCRARQLDFAQQADREAIGVGLIASLRAERPSA